MNMILELFKHLWVNSPTSKTFILGKSARNQPTIGKEVATADCGE